MVYLVHCIRKIVYLNGIISFEYSRVLSLDRAALPRGCSGRWHGSLRDVGSTSHGLVHTSVVDTQLVSVDIEAGGGMR